MGILNKPLAVLTTNVKKLRAQYIMKGNKALNFDSVLTIEVREYYDKA